MIIGITGRVGVGKSFLVDALIKKYSSIAIIDLDRVGHKFLLNSDIKQKLVAKFGEVILDENNEIQRSELGKIVFQDQASLMYLNTCMHPQIYKYVREQINLLKDKQDVLIVGALLKEIKLLPLCDTCIHINAIEELRSVKIKHKKAIEKHQLSVAVYREFTQHEVCNDYSKKAVENFVVLIQTLLSFKKLELS